MATTKEIFLARQKAIRARGKAVREAARLKHGYYEKKAALLLAKRREASKAYYHANKADISAFDKHARSLRKTGELG